MKYTVQSDADALAAIGHFFPNSSKTTIRSWIKDGRIFADGDLVKQANTPLKQGQLITFEAKKKLVASGVPIIYEDQHLVVVDKPSGLLSVEAAYEKDDTAHAYVKNYYRPRKVFVVHRIDQDTSGTLIFALDQNCYEKLKKIFEKHAIERRYIAIVEGEMKKEKGTWKSYLYEDDNYVVHQTDDPTKGEEAITHFKTLATSKKYSLLELTLKTGKKNQIRVHCQSAGHPIVGDKKYGSTTNPIKRLCLHAQLLAFDHPMTCKKLRFESPIPSGFHKLISIPPAYAK